MEKCENTMMQKCVQDFLDHFDVMSSGQDIIKQLIKHLFCCKQCLEKAVFRGLITKLLQHEFAGPFLICQIREEWHIQALQGMTSIPLAIFKLLPKAMSMHFDIVKKLLEFASPSGQY